MNLRHLEFLRLIVTLGSFGRAAQAAQVTQPAISQAMRSLQTDLGQALFERQGKRLVPTAAALGLAQAGQSLESTVDALMRGHRQSPPAHVLRVGMAPAAGLMYGARVYASLLDFAQRYVLHMETGPAPRLLSLLVSDELDLAIAPQPRQMRDDRLRRQHLYTSEPLVYCRQGHPLAQASSLDELQDASWVVAGAGGTPGNVIGEAFRVRRLPAPHVAVRCTDYAMLVRLVSQSDLLGVVPHRALLSSPIPHEVRALSIQEGLPHYAVCAFWIASERENELTRLIDHVVRAQTQPSGDNSP